MKKHSIQRAVLAAVALCCAGASAQDDQANPFNAVVKLEVQTRVSDFIRPWNSTTGSCTGSGVVIGAGRILTCAHCVADATYIRLRKNDEDAIYEGKVEFIDNDCDLALVKVEDEAFMSDIKPMKLGDTPQLQQHVLAVGYPIGGDSISFTEGIVSRIEECSYEQSHCNLLAVQVDAAINPGNSGGPVFDLEGDEISIVGIAFQGLDGGESLNYMIPPDVIRHFFKDSSDGAIDGFPQFRVEVQTLENEGARRYLKMKDGQTGVLVLEDKYDKPDGVLRSGDILLEVGGYKVANNGYIRIEGNEKRLFTYPFYTSQIGDAVKVKILRDGEEMDVSVTASKPDYKLCGWMYDKTPDYYVFGGCVFTTASYNFMLKLHHGFHDDVLKEKESPDDEPVVLSYVLADSATEGYLGCYPMLIRTVNGAKVRNLRHFIELVEATEDDFVRLMCDDDEEYDTPLYLDVKKTREATARVLEKYRIPADRSSGLK